MKGFELSQIMLAHLPEEDKNPNIQMSDAQKVEKYNVLKAVELTFRADDKSKKMVKKYLTT